ELELAVLCCKAPLREFYRRAGFGCVGLSAFVHGRDPWWDMKMVLAEEDLLFGQALLKGVKGDVGQLVSTVLSIEVASYPADEAATLESLTFRMTEVPELFLVAYEGAEIVGYICGHWARTCPMAARPSSTRSACALGAGAAVSRRGCWRGMWRACAQPRRGGSWRCHVVLQGKSEGPVPKGWLQLRGPIGLRSRAGPLARHEDDAGLRRQGG
ncbi:unnamed protein product, partial [Prorocentrum cordatum]